MFGLNLNMMLKARLEPEKDNSDALHRHPHRHP